MRSLKRGAVLALLVLGIVVGAVVTAPGRPSAAGKPLDLLWISDSSGWGVASSYAREIKQALRVPLRVHDQWEGGLPAAEILNRLRNPRIDFTGSIGQIRNAEVIVVYGNPFGTEIVKGGDCVTSNKPPAEVGPPAWPKYIATVKAIYKRIFEIRKGAPVIMRTYTMYVPVLYHAPSQADFPSVTSWAKAGIIDVCTRKFEWYAWAIRQAAAAYKVPVADVYTAFNGKTHREDPVAKGYIKPDNEHPNAKGAAVIAKTIAALGYKPVKPPG